MIIAELPKIPSLSASFEQNGTVLDPNNIEMKGSRYLKFQPLTNLSAGVVQVSMTENQTLHRSLQCTLQYSVKSAGTNELYALGVYIGVRLDDDSFGYAVCSLVRCATTDATSCGNPVDGHTANTVFETLKLDGTFPATSTVYATAFQSGLKLLSASDISVGLNNLAISDSTQPLLSASLWARVNPSGNPSNSQKFIIIGSTIGAVLLTAVIAVIVVVACVVFYKRRGKGYTTLN